MIFKSLWNHYKIWAPVFCDGENLLVRLSANVYCTQSDYVKLKDAILEMKDMSHDQLTTMSADVSGGDANQWELS